MDRLSFAKVFWRIFINECNCLATGIRLFEDDNDDSTDAMEALAFQHNRQRTDIYSCSWGPEDTGWTMEGPGKLTNEQLEEGAKIVKCKLNILLS